MIWFIGILCTERPDIRSQFNSVLYQLLLDPSERVCFEAIFCVLGKSDNTERFVLLPQNIFLPAPLCYHIFPLSQDYNCWAAVFFSGTALVVYFYMFSLHSHDIGLKRELLGGTA